MGAGTIAAGSCVLLCALACFSSVQIAQIVMGAKFLATEDCFIDPKLENYTCLGSNVSDHRVCGSPSFPFGLAIWNLVGGSVGIGSLVLLFLFGGGLALCISNDSLNGALGGTLCLLLLFVPMILFSLAWFIIGIIIMTSLTPDCKAENRPLWDMSVAALVFAALGICNSIFTSGKNRKDRDKYEQV